MTAYKLFSSESVADDLARFEQMVDDWLREQEPRIVGLTQSTLGTHLILSIVYELGGDETMVDVEEAEVPEVFERTMEQANLDPTATSEALLPEAELPY